MNRIIKIEQIDSWISKLTTTINSIKSGIDLHSTEIEDDEKALRRFEGLDQLENQILIMEKIDTRIQLKKALRLSLSDLQDRIQSKQKQIAILDLRPIEKMIKTVQELSDQINIKSLYFDHLHQAVQDYDVLDLKVTNLKVISTAFDKDIKLLGKLALTIESKKGLYQCLERYVHWRGSANKLTDKKDKLKKEYIKLVAELKICPLCQNPVTPKHIKELEKTL